MLNVCNNYVHGEELTTVCERKNCMCVSSKNIPYILTKKGGAFYNCSVPVFTRLTEIARNNYSIVA